MLEGCTQELATSRCPQASRPTEDHPTACLRLRGCKVLWDLNPNPKKAQPDAEAMAVGDCDLLAALLRTALQIHPEEMRPFFVTLFQESPSDRWPMCKSYQRAVEGDITPLDQDQLSDTDKQILDLVNTTRRAHNLH